MGGGMIQLVAYGGQDIHIIGNPEISFFKSVFRRHTNFAIECIKQDLIGTPSDKEFKASFKLDRKGDLIYKSHLEILLPEQKNLLLETGDNNFKFKFGNESPLNIYLFHWVSGEDDPDLPEAAAKGRWGLLQPGDKDKLVFSNSIQYKKFIKYIEVIKPGKNYINGARIDLYLNNTRFTTESDETFLDIGYPIFKSGKIISINIHNSKREAIEDWIETYLLSQIFPDGGPAAVYYMKNINITIKIIPIGNYGEGASAKIHFSDCTFSLDETKIKYELTEIKVAPAPPVNLDELTKFYRNPIIKVKDSPHLNSIDFGLDIGSSGEITKIYIKNIGREAWEMVEALALDAGAWVVLPVGGGGVVDRRPILVSSGTLANPDDNSYIWGVLKKGSDYPLEIEEKYNSQPSLLNKVIPDVNAMKAADPGRLVKDENGYDENVIDMIPLISPEEEVRLLDSDSINGALFTGNYPLSQYISNTHNYLINSMTKRKKQWINYMENTAYSYIKEIDISIGEQIIDKHSGNYLDISNSIYNNSDLLNTLISNGPYNRNTKSWPPHDKNNKFKSLVPQELKLIVPLEFWFNKHISQALPIIALQYHEVKINVLFRDLRAIIKWDAGIINSGENEKDEYILDFSDDEKKRASNRELIKPDINLWVEYIYLDTDERVRFSKSSHEYLIEQIQTIKDTYKPIVNIPFNHSVKTLFWVIQHKICSTEVKDFNNCKLEPIEAWDTIEINWQKNNVYKWIPSLIMPFDKLVKQGREDRERGGGEPSSSGVWSKDLLYKMYNDLGLDPDQASHVHEIGDPTIPLVITKCEPFMVRNSDYDNNILFFNVIPKETYISQDVFEHITGARSESTSWPGNDAIPKYNKFNITGKMEKVMYTDNNSALNNGFTQGNNYLWYGNHLNFNSKEDNLNVISINNDKLYEAFEKCKIVMNNIDRTSFMDSTYYRYYEPYKNISSKSNQTAIRPIYMYSFCLDPQNHQPTGACNFSKLDSVELHFKGDSSLYNDYNIYIYAKNYNILRIMEGMGGLLYNS